MICGDFNTIFTQEDKNKGDVNTRDITTSQYFVNKLNLMDPPLHSCSYNWTNGQANPI